MTDPSDAKSKRLSPAAQALLQKRLQGNAGNQAAAPDVRDPTAPMPLTPLQTQLWALAQSHPDIPAYHMHRAIRFTGQLNLQDLNRAINTVVSRHEALRIVFRMQGREILQLVRPATNILLTAENVAQSVAAAQKELARSFDLDSGPLIRFTLFREEDDQFLLLIVVHHIVADEWSLEILLREMNCVYNGQNPPVENPLQYGDYVVKKLADIDSHSPAHVEFWRQRLADIDTSLQLPFDFDRPPIQSYEGDFCRQALDPELVQRLSIRARELGVTPFVVFYTVFKILLFRLSGQNRFAIGVPSANRVGGGAETAIGLFVASLPLDCDISHEQSIVDCIDASQNSLLDAMTNLDYSFDDLLSAIDYDRKPGINPVFQTMFVMETDSLSELSWSGLGAERLELTAKCSKFDLTLFVDSTHGSPSVAVEFSTALFDHSTALQLLATYVRVLGQIDESPGVSIGHIDILPAAMRQQLLTDLGIGVVADTANRESLISLPEQIAQIATANPDAIAVVCDGLQLRYGELFNRATYVARRLIDEGVRGGDFVALFIERSVEQIVALLAVQMAGAAYVPLDPDYPQDRLDFVFDDLARNSKDGVPFVVTTQDQLTRLADQPRLILVDGDNVDQPARILPPIDLESPAYVIYTSGSSGRPKGVVVSHSNLAWSTNARRQYYDSPQCFLMVSSIAFDSSIAGIFWTLSCGGSLCIPSVSESRDPTALCRLITAMRITHTLMLPSLWHWILRQSADNEMGTLNTVIVAGESCARVLVDYHHAVMPNTQLFNEYGPTEATVWASVHRCTVHSRTGSVPIGSPIAGTRLYVLDEYMNPVPIGVRGELFIGGHGVAQGYLSRTDETTARFVADPFSAGHRLFRSGDQVKWNSDGVLEFFGRADGQLKLRGYRIESAEIETLLCSYSDVDDCGVTLVDDNESGAADTTELIELAQRLPATLVEQLLADIENSGDIS